MTANDLSSSRTYFCRNWHLESSVASRFVGLSTRIGQRVKDDERLDDSGCRGFIGPVPPPLWMSVRLAMKLLQR